MLLKWGAAGYVSVHYYDFVTIILAWKYYMIAFIIYLLSLKRIWLVLIIYGMGCSTCFYFKFHYTIHFIPPGILVFCAGVFLDVCSYLRVVLM